jgi:cytochrome c-type biogenesis protein CcmH
MVQRYGDFVLYRPPLKASTVLLWGGPFLLLGFGALLLIRRIRSTNRQAPALSAAERARAAAFLDPGRQ